jgi:hypothetical protein
MNLEVEVRPRARDAIMSGWLMMRGRPMLLTVFLGFFVGLPWSYVLLVVLFRGPGSTATVVEMTVLPILAVLFFFAGIPLASYGASKRSPAFGDIVHRITDAGITSVGTGWDRTVQWPAITACTRVAWRLTSAVWGARRPVPACAFADARPSRPHPQPAAQLPRSLQSLTARPVQASSVTDTRLW